MIWKRCLYAVVVLSVAVQTAELSAQPPYQPETQSGGTTWISDAPSRLPAESPRPEPAEQHAGAKLEPLPSVLDGNQDGDPAVTVTNPLTTDPAVDLTIEPEADPVHATGLRDFWGYRYRCGSLDWIIGNQFGMFSLKNNHYQNAGLESGIGVGLDFNFVSGPAETDMPPRLYDFSLAYQCRRRIGVLAYDVAASVMASSDFDGSAREGIRYPGHAVGFLRVGPAAELVFGVDYLDWGDIKLLPVGGLIWTPNDKVRLELVFPRPRATFALPPSVWPWNQACEGCSPTESPDHKEHRFYIAGDLGGGTWAVERGGKYDDLATYRDLRVRFGLECVGHGGARSALEVAYLFDRRLIFTSGNGNMRLDDTAMIRWITCY